MKTRRIIIAMILAFCFIASMLMVMPIKSANSPYDPWLDFDDNGAVGLTDLVSLANSYGTTGDPTKNVNVTNPEYSTVWIGDYQIDFHGDGSSNAFWIRNGENPAHIGGYEKMTIFFNCLEIPTILDTQIYLQAIVSWSLDREYFPGHIVPTTLYSLSIYDYFSKISSDPLPIEAPYAFVTPMWYAEELDVNGTLTIGVYLYLSNGPTLSSTRKTMMISGSCSGNLTAIAPIKAISLDGFTQLSIYLFSNVTLDGRIIWGMTTPDNEWFTLTPSPYSKTYELHAASYLYLQFYNPSSTPYTIYWTCAVMA